MICKFKEICFNYPSKCELCNATSDIVNNYPCFQNKDIVEVVRCKNCKHCLTDDYTIYCDSAKGLDQILPDDYCSYGERKEE